MKQDVDTLSKKTFLKDYSKPDFQITEVELEFDLDPQSTVVRSKLKVKKLNPKTDSLFLNGENLKLRYLKVNGELVKDEFYSSSEQGLNLKNLKSNNFVIETECLISPQSNLSLEGLYISGNILCTQNEPEGFRRITYFLDRPDNMSIYTVKLIADKSKYPYLLANGNLVERGELSGNKHWCIWHDPFPKPSYLFAIVAGELGLVKDKFTTQSGRQVSLEIYCDPGQEDKCKFAMISLKKSMKWDEERFNLEYDLDQYMIVSVGSFNAGAMENKGLNIFNSALVLADQETATDMDYLAIESVIAHEYFHNWTGNRVTCRDWFQLTLKEGLTVFRDQEFSADMNSKAVQRIQDVRNLKEVQFSEDASPMAHPIRPETFVQINNFYTPTVYEKGAEVIRMIHTFLGEEGFQKGMKKYFELFDGKAVTTEDFVHSMKLANPHFEDEKFKKWYSQVGTPCVEISTQYDESKMVFKLNYKQSLSKQNLNFKSLYIPFKVGFLDSKGLEFKPELKTETQPYWNQSVLALSEPEGCIVFENIKQKPTLSLNRFFSAPVHLKVEQSLEDEIKLLEFDSDLFNRYEVGQKLIADWIYSVVQKKSDLKLNPKIITAFAGVINDTSMDMHMKSLLLMAPTESVIHQKQKPIDFIFTKKARDSYLDQMSVAFEKQFHELYSELNYKTRGEFRSENVGPRALKNVCLSFLSRCGDTYKDLVLKQFHEADNMTDQFQALHLMNTFFGKSFENENQKFYVKWKSNDLVLQKWISAQLTLNDETIYDKVFKIKSLPEFDSSVPNFNRSLWGGFSRNFVMFHDESGQGYEILADQIIELDSINRSIAAALAKSYRIKPFLSSKNQELINECLLRIKSKKEISSNLLEVVEQILNS